MTSASCDASTPADLVPPAPRPHPAPTDGHLSTAPRVEVEPDGCRASLDLPAQEAACATARSTVRQLLRAWEVGDDELAHDVVLVVSELVGNAVRHGGVPLVLDLALDLAPHLALDLGPHPGGDGGRAPGPAGLTVGVTDASPGLPQQRRVDGGEEGGRGLTIVAALAQDWGVEPVGVAGKRVWARLPVVPRSP